jgi:hypothetical protein
MPSVANGHLPSSAVAVSLVPLLLTFSIKNFKKTGL